MSQTTETDPRTQMPLPAIDEIQRRLLVSLASPELTRIDLRALRALPTWRGVMWARVAFKAKAITRRELDTIAHEAEFGGVKLDKRSGPVVTDAAVEVLCAAVYDGWEGATDEFRAERRQALRVVLVAAVSRLDWSDLIPDIDQLDEAISDPGTVLRRAKDESVPRWAARAVNARIRGKLFG